jgi:hypothetical protein
MAKRRSGRLLLCLGWTALAAASASVFSFSSAEASTVVAQHSGMCLDVRGGPQAIEDGRVIEQWDCTGATNQNWTLQDMGDGKFRLAAQNSGKCIEPINGGTANGTGLHQMTCSTSSRQLWKRDPELTGSLYRLIHMDSNRCLDVPNGSLVEGELLILFNCNAGQHQRWAISETEFPPPKQPIVVKHSGLCLDVRGGPQATNDGALIEQWTCTGATNQNWTMRPAGSGQIELVAENSGKCIQTVAGGTVNQTGLEQRACDGSAGQRWTRQNLAAGLEYRFQHVQSNRCLDIPGSSTAAGALAQIFDCTGNPNQTWTIGASAEAPATVQLTNGEYWSLPARYPAKSPHGGLNQIWGRAINWSPTTDLHWVGAYWRDLNPAEGQYRWDRIESINGEWTYSLNQLGALGKTALIWTAIAGRDETTWHAPQWVLNKCQAAGTPVKVINNGDGTPWGLALWESCPRTQLLRFIREMFTRYRNDARVEYAYATTFNAGEFWMPAAVYNDAKSKGFTPAILESYAKAIINEWVSAVGVKKVIWTAAHTWDLPGDDTAVETDRVNSYALMTLGTQLREGNAESLTAQITQSLIGQGVVDVVPRPMNANPAHSHWYLTAQPIQQMGREGVSFYGNEFEIANLAGVFGNYNYYRLAVLNMLRKHQNWAIFPHDLRTGANDAAQPQFAALRDYFRQSAGYPVAEAPDAWAVLHEFYDDCWNGSRHYHNYEKFLLQREVASGGRTVVTEQHTWPNNQYGFCAVGTGGAEVPAVTFFARRTDRASGNNYIYFDVDSGFAPASERRFMIAVTYRDAGTTAWRLEYSTATAANVPTPTVTNTNTGTLKTAIFTLSDVSFRNAQEDGMDFRIFNGGSADVIVRSVRVIRGGP